MAVVADAVEVAVQEEVGLEGVEEVVGNNAAQDGSCHQRPQILHRFGGHQLRRLLCRLFPSASPIP